MRIIYIVRSRLDGTGRYPGRYAGRWYDPGTWYGAGLVLSYVLQFAAGFGIGWLIKCVVIALRAL